MNKKLFAYLGLFFVVFVWGLAPLLTLELYKFYSPTIRVLFSEIILIVTYLIISKKHLKGFNLDYIKVGIPTGFFLALANISQKVGLIYTTPAKYAFLENLSCITVPIVMFILVRKKPKFMTIVSCIVCLISIFILSGISLKDTSAWGIGETLCALSGLLYGFNIAGTSVYAKDLYAPLYLVVQSFVSVLMSFMFALVFNYTTITSKTGQAIPIEKIFYSVKPSHFALLIIITVVCSALCWIIRTNAMKHIDASIVVIIMPFSSVVTSVISVIWGNDILNLNLVLGGILGVLAIFLSSYDDIFKRKLSS
ncbi:MAG: DMT family transporter [Oscillospiraceae bacterium]|nr:DMT family transporter [Oscillospiraceae bacterium]